MTDQTPREIMLDRIEASRVGKKPRRIISVNWSDVLFMVVNRAAKKRGISKSAYVRRAAVALACHDLGLDYAKVMEGEAGTLPYGKGGGKPEEIGESKNGMGYGQWAIRALEGEPDG